MKILQIGPIPPEFGGGTRGGVATHVWDLSTHLAARNHQVAVLADNTFTDHKGPEIKEVLRSMVGIDKGPPVSHPIHSWRTSVASNAALPASNPG
jgi:hypothetical protein